MVHPGLLLKMFPVLAHTLPPFKAIRSFAAMDGPTALQWRQENGRQVHVRHAKCWSDHQMTGQQ